MGYWFEPTPEHGGYYVSESPDVIYGDQCGDLGKLEFLDIIETESNGKKVRKTFLKTRLNESQVKTCQDMIANYE